MRRRANGQGSVYKDSQHSTYCAQVTKYVAGEKIVKRKYGFKTKKEAYEWLSSPREEKSSVCFAKVYADMMARQEARVSKSTIDCYKAAYKYYEPLYYRDFADLVTADWQACIDACPHGKRTRQNMKAVGTLMYRYAIENRIAEKDYATFIWIPSEEADERIPFSDMHLQLFFNAANHGDERAMLTICMCYTGFRPTEFFTLKKYDGEFLVGGAKTDAGKNRKVPVSDKIKPFVDYFAAKKADTIFGNGRQFRETGFYELLSELGIQKPGEKKYQPYACRHTFATMLKSVEGSAIDKSALMGHTSPTMTAHYQHETDEELVAIIEKL